MCVVGRFRRNKQKVILNSADIRFRGRCTRNVLRPQSCWRFLETGRPCIAYASTHVTYIRWVLFLLLLVFFYSSPKEPPPPPTVIQINIVKMRNITCQKRDILVCVCVCVQLSYCAHIVCCVFGLIKNSFLFNRPRGSVSH